MTFSRGGSSRAADSICTTAISGVAGGYESGSIRGRTTMGPFPNTTVRAKKATPAFAGSRK